MTDAELNNNIKLAPHDKFIKWTLLWMFPHSVKPNQITVMRFLLSPVVFFLFVQGYYRIGFVLFLLTALTDAIDGSMARTRRQVTIWGTVYDGVADKVLIIGVVLIFVFKYLGFVLGIWVIGVEFVTILAALFYKRRGIIHTANWWGKIKMNLQVWGTAALLVYIIWEIAIFVHISFWIFVGSLATATLSIMFHARRKTDRPRRVIIKPKSKIHFNK